jgi:hypothetical protein
VSNPLTSKTVRGTGGLTTQETAKFFHIDFTSLLDTDLESITSAFGSTVFLEFNLKGG